MSAKHTPGPWKTYIPSGFEEGFEEIAVGSICGAVCETIDGNDWEEKCANATLISAAPDLLAAAEAMVEQLIKLDGFPDLTSPYSGARVGLRAAIAKAKGHL